MAGGRPVGTNNEYRVAKKTVTNMLELESWVNDNFDEATTVLQELLLDKKATSTVRRGVAETIIALHKHFYTTRKGIANPTIEEMEAHKTSIEKEEKPLLSLTMQTGTGD